jgi:biopolymer transport protein ExbB
MNNIRANVAAGNIVGAKALCQTVDSPVARMVEKGLQRIGKPLRDIDAAIENVGNLEIFKLEKNLSRLASIAGAAPMIGFFGTVTGMILAFYEMATAQNVTPSVLAGGIYQALLTTAFGLAIGIFAFVGYNLLVANVDKVVYKMERYTVDFMDLLQEPTA